MAEIGSAARVRLVGEPPAGTGRILIPKRYICHFEMEPVRGVSEPAPAGGMAYVQREHVWVFAGADRTSSHSREQQRLLLF